MNNISTCQTSADNGTEYVLCVEDLKTYFYVNEGIVKAVDD